MEPKKALLTASIMIGVLILSIMITYPIFLKNNENPQEQNQTTNNTNEDNSQEQETKRKFPTFETFLATYKNASEENKTQVINEFVKEQSKYGFPIVNKTHATFFYLGTQTTQQVSVAGDFNGWDPSKDPMKKLENSNVFYLTKTFESDARLDYKFVIGSQWILDPLNNKTVMGGFGPNSELAMPDYVQPPEIEYYENIPHGTIIEHKDVYAPMLGNSRTIYVYLPPNYSQQQTYPVIYIHDGKEFMDLASIKNILDYSIYHNITTPLIAVLIPPITPYQRINEYNPNEPFAQFISEIVVPLIDKTYSTIQNPSGRAMMGVSLGGLISTYICFTRPNLFGKIASMSGAFWYNKTIINQINSSPKTNQTFYLDWGTYEPTIMSSSKELVAVLQAKGYTYTTNEWHEGHSWGNWRAHVDIILNYFFPPTTP